MSDFNKTNYNNLSQRDFQLLKDLTVRLYKMRHATIKDLTETLKINDVMIWDLILKDRQTLKLFKVSNIEREVKDLFQTELILTTEGHRLVKEITAR